jgi:hypothetical protein
MLVFAALACHSFRSLERRKCACLMFAEQEICRLQSSHSHHQTLSSADLQGHLVLLELLPWLLPTLQ